MHRGDNKKASVNCEKHRFGAAVKICAMFASAILIFTYVTVMSQMTARAESSPEGKDISIKYTNTDTGYDLVIDDRADLLTEEQEEALFTVMEPITKYGGVAFLTVDTNDSTAEGLARSFYREKFGTDNGTLFLIDMDNRKIWIHSDGAIYKVITTSNAETITDNVFRYASAGNYYDCAANAYDQIFRLLEGERIARPMKYISNAVLAVILALLANFVFVSRYAKLKKPTDKILLANMEHSFNSTKPTVKYTGETKVYDPVSDSSSSGGSSGGGGGSSGGSSGGGGGHSF